MRLSDHILSEVGGATDVGGIFTNTAAALREAERFELSDDVARAAYNLTRSKPSSLLAALPMSRAPYRKIWLEWRGGLTADWVNFEYKRPESFAPNPLKQGCLIEADASGTRGFMTFAWLHKDNPQRMGRHLYSAVNISPLGALFNWNEGADVQEDAVAELDRRYPTQQAKASPAGVMDQLIYTRHARRLSDDDVKQWMEKSVFEKWGKFAGIESERNALMVLDRHMVPFIPPHAVGFLGWCGKEATQSERQLTNFLNFVVKVSWAADIEGEPPFAEAVIAMMNSRNAIEHRPIDLTALNKSRTKRGRQIFLPYRTTHLRLSRAQQRAFRAGLLSREQAGLHTVRGHFKIRRTGVYWWSPFFRGDASRSIERQEYEVQE